MPDASTPPTTPPGPSDTTQAPFGAPRPAQGPGGASAVVVQDNAMIDDLGQVFFADNEDDAAVFARDHGARPVYPDRWPFPEPRWYHTYPETVYGTAL